MASVRRGRAAGPLSSFVGRLESAALELMTPRVRRAWSKLSGRRDAFKGAEVNRLLADWVTTILHPDDEMQWNIRRLRARARDLSRNNPYARFFLNALATNVIGPYGIRHQAQVRDNDGKRNRLINQKIEAAWAEWCEAPTVDGRMSLEHFERLQIKSVARDGESFIRMWPGYKKNRFRFAIQGIDPDQLDEMFNRKREGGANEIRLGIEVNEDSRPVAYHFWDGPEKVMQTSRERTAIPAEVIFHLMDPERVNQTRGITWYIAVMVTLKMLDGYSEAELVAARTAAAKMGWFTRKTEGAVGEMPVDPVTGNVGMEANPGSIEFAPDGYEFQEWSPEHPTSAFAAFVKSKLREIASGVSMSYNALANDLEGVNYSSMRSGLLIERETWRTLQNWWISSFRRRLYREWLNSALLSGALVLDSRDARKFYEVKWSPRGWPWVDPLNDTQAGVLGVQTGLASRTRLLAERGEDFEEVIEELKEEMEIAEEYGVDIAGPVVGVVASGDEEDDSSEEDDSADDDSSGKKKKKKAKGRAVVLAALRSRRNGHA